MMVLRGAIPRTHLRRRARERGLTLLETLITVVLLGIGIAGIMLAVASAERIATINQNQSQLELAMRRLADYVRDSNPSTGLPYSPCAQVSTYQSQLPPTPSGVSQWRVVQVSESVLGTGFHDGTATAPKAACTANTGDWGVQEIKLAVSGGGNQIVRTIWKSDSWCYNPQQTPPQC